jgi:hypothetical protein
MTIVYFFVAFGFSLRTLLNHDVVDKKQFIYLSHYITNNGSSERVLFDEHPSVLCICVSIVFMLLSLVQSTTDNSFVDSTVVVVLSCVPLAVLLCVLAGVIDMVLFFALTGEYVAMHLLLHHEKMYMALIVEEVQEFEKTSVRTSARMLAVHKITRIVMVLLGILFWGSVFVLIAVSWFNSGLARFFSYAVAFLGDLYTMKKTKQQLPDNLLRDQLAQHIARLTLLVCVFAVTL